jgi:hypothetical protein
MQVYNSFSECRNAGLTPSQDAAMIVLSMGDTHSSAFSLQTQNHYSSNPTGTFIDKPMKNDSDKCSSVSQDRHS